MSPASEAPKNLGRPPGQRVAFRELLLLYGSVISLITSCVLWSAHKQAWMDEIFTWKEVSDRSLWHLFHAVQHGADGGQPLFYATAWLWARTFGTGVLALRLYSSVAICGALVVTWTTLRRFYGMWATAFGVLAFWGTSGVLLEQNAEARFYGLYLFAVAITVHIYTRLVARAAPTPALLVLVFASQAALVWTHVLGLIYSGLILLALVLSDAAKARFRLKVYLIYAAGWLALLLWIPAIRASMAAGKPHGWIAMPTITDLRTAYLFADSLQWLRLFKRHSFELGFQIVSRMAEFVIYVPLAVVFVFGLRSIWKSGWRVVASARGSLVLAAYALLSAPVVLFLVSHLVTPVFISRYLLPSGIGLAIILAASANELGADLGVSAGNARRVIWPAIAMFLLVSPLLTVIALGSPDFYRGYLDVQRLEHVVPRDIPVVAGWQEDFAKLMRYSQNPNIHYYFLLDWPAALVGPRAFVLDYHLMKAYQENGYYPQNIQDSQLFICSHRDFVVLDAPNANTLDSHLDNSPDMEKPNWFDVNIRGATQFQWKVIESLDASEVTRRLIVVHRVEPLPYCDQQ